jgi:hypothetical protein
VKYEDRRKELGKMLMDVAKYLATVGLIGSVLTNSLTILGGITITVIVVILVLIAFYTIPLKQ